MSICACGCGAPTQKTFVHGHNRRRPAAERFAEKVNKTATCWLWTGRISREGYGQTWDGTRVVYAHRLSFEMANGAIPEGAFVDHLCHTRACVKPNHLRAATAAMNQENRAGATRASKSGVRGVFWDTQRGKWRVGARSAGRTYYGGHFTDLQEADKAARALRAAVHHTTDIETAR